MANENSIGRGIVPLEECLLRISSQEEQIVLKAIVYNFSVPSN